MKTFLAWLLMLLLPALVRAEPPGGDDAYKRPFPHSSGAELLPYCEDADLVVNQLRCDYYVQGVADLATMPRQGTPAACIPQGQTRTQLMLVATTYLKSLSVDVLESQSAASLILQAFNRVFPCPKAAAVAAGKKPAGTNGKQQLSAIYKQCESAGSPEAVRECVGAAINKPRAAATPGKDALAAIAKQCSGAGSHQAMQKCVGEAIEKQRVAKSD